MFVQLVLLLLGFFLLIKGAGWLVDGAASLAVKYNVSKLIIGLTIVAFGTSAPELAINAIASYQNHPEIVLGNIIGSNIFNLFLILGIAGLITPLAVQSGTVWKEIPLSFVAVLMLFVLANNFPVSEVRILSRLDGLILVCMFALFLGYIIRQLHRDIGNGIATIDAQSNFKLAALILIGLVVLVIGARLTINAAVRLATILGVSEKIIGLTIVAAGTSLPELATSVVAAIKKNNDIAIGNVIGSNIFNICLILAVSVLIRPIVFDVRFNADIGLLAGGTLFLFIAMFTGEKKSLDRWEAGILLAAFAVYMGYLIAQAR
ncbi:MAG: calcium/sodium antiporter [Fidelibacterota bacterium]